MQNNKERTIGNKTHREQPRDRVEILGVKKETRGIELKRSLERVIKDIKSAIKKNQLSEDMYVYKASSEELEFNTFEAVSLDSEKELNDLVLITKDYLRPYLQFVYDNKHVYRASFRNPYGMQVHTKYRYLKDHILEPILARFEIPDIFHKYYIAYYIEGIAAIIREWLHTNCKDSIDTIATVIEECVRPLYEAQDMQRGESEHIKKTNRLMK